MEPRILPQSNGNLYIVSAASGTGKTSLVSELLQRTDNLQVSISHTTRKPRPGEEHGKHYYFVEEASFLELVAQQAFLEHAKVFDHYYGTLTKTVQERLSEGVDLILEIDWQGARQVRKVFPNAHGIFILPPSRESLRQRLSSRAQDDEAIINQRMQSAIAEMSHYKEFNYLVINDDFETALAEMQSIILANRSSLSRQMAKNAELISSLISDS
jgi:guanylate kinase